MTQTSMKENMGIYATSLYFNWQAFKLYINNYLTSSRTDPSQSGRHELLLYRNDLDDEKGGSTRNAS